MTSISIESHFSALLERENVTEKKAFGMPSLFINGNMFLSIMAESVGLKLDEGGTEMALSITGAKAMNLGGWTEVPFSLETDWMLLAENALEYVSKMPPKKKKK